MLPAFGTGLGFRRQRVLLLAGGVCILHLIPACGSTSNAADDPAGTSAGATGSSGSPGEASGDVSGGGALAAGSGSLGTAGAAAGSGATGSSGASGAMGSIGGATGAAGTSGAAGGKGSMGGATGGAGSKGTAGAGSAGAGSAGSAGSAGAPGGGGCTTPPAGSALIGWASQSGMGVTTTTGGGSTKAVTVSTLSALTSAVSSDTAKVVYVTGKLAAGKVKIGSNTTLVGLCGAEIHGHLGIGNVSNVIIRNLKIVGYGVGNCALDPDYDSSVGCSSGNDAISINSQAHHVWIDHCDVSDGTDGNLDTTQGADFVTISWTKFHYTSRSDNTGNDSTGAEGHRFSNLIGAADNVSGDTGHLNITWHHDWWADNVDQRMPRSRAGKIHLFNNLFTASGNSYCSNAGQGAALLVENSVYSGVKAPFQVVTGAVGLVSKGNTFPGSSGTTTGSGSAFTPPYAYTPESASAVQADVQANAGPQ